MTRKRTPAKRKQPFANSGEDAVREAETQFRLLTEQWLVGIVIIQAGQFKYVNPALIKMMGYSQAELLAAASVLEFVAEEDRALVRENLRLREEGENPTINYSFRVRRKDGALLDLEVCGSRVSFQGRFAVMSTVLDVTEHKRAENTLRESEHRYRLLFENMLDGYAYCRMLFDHDEPQDFVYMDVNEAFERLTGLKNVVGKKVSEVIPGIRDSNPELFEIYGRVALTGKPEKFETYVESLGIWFSVSVYSSAREYFIAVFDNITERKRSVEALRQSENRYRTLIETAPDSIVELSMDWTVLSLNHSFETLTGWSREEMLGINYTSFLHPDDLSAAMNLFRAVLQNERLRPHEWRIRRKSGDYAAVEFTAAPRFEHGQVSSVFSIMRDITERTRLQAQFLQAQKMEVVGRLASGIAHDFNNLLTIINGTSELASTDLREDDPLRKDFHEIRSAGERAASLTRQLLAFSRRQVMKLEVLNLSTVVAHMQNMLQRLIGEDIDLVVVPAKDVDSVIADVTQIEQVVMNLIINARDAMPNGGTLTIETRNVELDEAYAARHSSVQPGPHVMLAISDTGVGMDEATRTRIFEPFFTTKGPGKGTGLGLSTAYGIVKQSGGSIWVYTELGKGTTFRIYLPRVEEVARKLQPAPTMTAVQGTETILVVEDDEGVRHLAKRILQSLGYTVLTASNGAEALLLLERHDGPVHLMLTDMVMPGMSGRDLATQLEPISPQMKVLYTSGYTDDAVLHHGLLDKTAHFIGKPYATAELTRKVREVLDS